MTDGIVLRSRHEVVSNKGNATSSMRRMFLNVGKTIKVSVDE